ncbi:ShlB/FhaC/HecB family hemolysin secretion/activation protein [Sphingomonas sp.]|uniref:ShlB/FhaC/HecB family hemolysin secretion/activation protein n=1 Tax=Sphingomonas sp. TaxID=28214 RepID=UPI002E121031
MIAASRALAAAPLALIAAAPVWAQDAPEASIVALNDVAVTAVPADLGAAPRTRRSAQPQNGQPLQLRYGPGEPIDPAWVRGHFERAGLIGRPASNAALVDMVQIINAAILRDGLINTGVVIEPQPALENGGTLRLRLVYGRLGSADGASPPIVINWGGKGSRGLSDAFVAAEMRSAARTPVDAVAIERDFRLLSDHPAVRTVRADLKALNAPGEAQLALSVEAAPRYDLYVTVANNRSPSVGGERAALGGSMRNLLASTDLFSFEGGRTSGVTDAVVSYSAPLIDYDLRLNVRAGLNNAAVIDPELLALDISARDRFVEAGISYQFWERPLTPVEGGRWTSARALSAGLTFLHRRTRTFLFGKPFSFTPGSVRGRAEYSALRGSIEFVDRGPSQAITLSLIGTLGLEGTRSDVPGLPQPDENFTAAALQLNYARRLTPDRLELRGRLTVQWTSDLLYTAERFSVGGSNSVRGYRENLILSDRGAVASVELAQPFSLSGRSAGRSDVDLGSFSASLFADAAYVDNVGAADPSPRWITGIGASLLWTPSEALTARIIYGEALKSVPVVGRRDLQDKGVQFMVTVRPLYLLGYR